MSGEGGRIIMIGSVNSDITPIAGGSIYGLAKGAIASFNRSLARDLGSCGITVNNIQPGPIDTDMNPADGDLAVGGTKMTALGRYGQGDEVAGWSLISPVQKPPLSRARASKLMAA